MHDQKSVPMLRARRFSLAALACLPVLALAGIWSAAPARAVDIVVSTTTDGVPGSLRAAITAANATAGHDTITVPAGTYVLTVNGRFEDGNATGDLDITDDVTIQGAGAGQTIIVGSSGSGASLVYDRVLDLFGDPVPDVTLNDLTVTEGRVDNGIDGAGIRNSSSLLRMNRTVVTGNLTFGVFGGGSSGQGGGVATLGGGLMDATRCAFTSNRANSAGGGIYKDGDGSLFLRNCTLSGNSSGSLSALGGGLHVTGGSTEITHCTIAANRSTFGSGGIFNAGGGTLTIQNTILHNSSSNEPSEVNFGGVPAASLGGNISNDMTCAGFFTGLNDRNDIDPILLPLDNYGSGIPTHALHSSSPALDTAVDAGFTLDARGLPRPQDGNGDDTAAPDVGSFETQRPASLSVTVSNANASGPGSMRSAIIAANYLPGANTITLAGVPYPVGVPGTGENLGATGDFDITDTLTLAGANRTSTIIDGGMLDRCLHAISPIFPIRPKFDAAKLTSFTLRDVTVRNGRVQDTVSETDGSGAGIKVDGVLSLTRVTISGNSILPVPGALAGAGTGGGGVYVVSGTPSAAAAPSLTVVDSTFTNNSAPASGGGLLYDDFRGTLTLTGSTFTNNTAYGGAGASATNAVITNCTFTNNTAGDAGGGGYQNEGGSLSVTNSLFDHNTAADDGGGGFENEGGSLEMTDVTVTNNTGGADGGGGFENEGGSLAMTGCLVAGNSA